MQPTCEDISPFTHGFHLNGGRLLTALNQAGQYLYSYAFCLPLTHVPGIQRRPKGGRYPSRIPRRPVMARVRY